MIDNCAWDEAAKDMKDLGKQWTPTEKLNVIVRVITTISRAYSLLSDTGDDVTADDIL